MFSVSQYLRPVNKLINELKQKNKPLAISFERKKRAQKAIN